MAAAAMPMPPVRRKSRRIELNVFMGRSSGKGIRRRCIPGEPAAIMHSTEHGK
jgi:hypothetical protein